MTTFTGLGATARTTASISSGVFKPGSIENIGPDVGKGGEAPYRVLQVGASGDQILRSRREHERKRQGACRLYRGTDPLDGQVVRIDRVASPPGRVFDGPSDESDCGRAQNGFGAGFRVVTEPVLQVLAETGSEVASTIARAFASVSSRPIAPSASGLAVENANPALVVASASNPSVVRMLADPASEGLGIAKIPGLSWRDLKTSARAD